MMVKALMHTRECRCHVCVNVLSHCGSIGRSMSNFTPFVSLHDLRQAMRKIWALGAGLRLLAYFHIRSEGLVEVIIEPICQPLRCLVFWTNNGESANTRRQHAIRFQNGTYTRRAA